MLSFGLAKKSGKAFESFVEKLNTAKEFLILVMCQRTEIRRLLVAFGPAVGAGNWKQC